MKILNQPQINYRESKPAFTSNARQVLDASGQLLYRNNTAFFREDLKWGKFVDTLNERYKDVDKVHIYNYACSEGAEPFSLAMLLIEKLGKEGAKKFFPIIASDIDAEVLKNPKQGIIKLSKEDIEYIKEELKNNASKYIEYDNVFQDDPKFREKLCNGRIKPILKDTVIFKNLNIMDDLANIEKDNSIVMCRNFWPYLNSYENQLKLAQTLSEKLGENSMCVIGDFDYRIGSMLEAEQFHDYFKDFDKEYTGGIKNLYYVKNPPKKNTHLCNPNFLMKIFANTH